jgi:hypothetical protein
MTGWTQFTARFESEQEADSLSDHFEQLDENGSLEVVYNKTFGHLLRVRVFGYGQFETTLSQLERLDTPTVVILAEFNDTSDSGRFECYQRDSTGRLQEEVTRYSGEAMRWDSSLTMYGVKETGIRAGQDFDLEDEYDSANAA